MIFLTYSALLNLMPLKIQSGFSTIIIVILIVLLAALVLGGIYYYTQIYHPARYAKAVISLFDGITEDFQRTNLQVEGRTTTPALAQEALKSRKELLSQSQNQLSKLNPPPKMKQFHEDFTKAVAWLIIIYDGTDGLLNFLINLNDLRNNVDLDEIVKEEPKPKTVADLSKRLSDYFSRAKTESLEVFKAEPAKLRGEITVSNLKTSWKDMEPALDVVLKFIDSQDQNLPLDALSQLADQNKEFREALDKIEKFVNLSGNVFGLNSPAYIFSSDFITEDQPKDINLSELDSTIKVLKQKYQK